MSSLIQLCYVSILKFSNVTLPVVEDQVPNINSTLEAISLGLLQIKARHTNIIISIFM